jgi:hypothetical protein
VELRHTRLWGLKRQRETNERAAKWKKGKSVGEVRDTFFSGGGCRGSHFVTKFPSFGPLVLLIFVACWEVLFVLPSLRGIIVTPCTILPRGRLRAVPGIDSAAATHELLRLLWYWASCVGKLALSGIALLTDGAYPLRDVSGRERGARLWSNDLPPRRLLE